MSFPRLATFYINGGTRYGVVTDSGIVDLSARCAKDYPTLREVIAAGALTKLADEAALQGIVPRISARTVGRLLVVGRGRGATAPEPVLAHARTGRPGRVRRAGADGV